MLLVLVLKILIVAVDIETEFEVAFLIFITVLEVVNELFKDVSNEYN